MADTGASAGIPTTPAELFAAARACLAAADIPSFDAHVDRLLRIAPHWYEGLFLAAASFEPRDPARADELYRRALRSRAESAQAAAGVIRCRLAVGAALPFHELALMARLPLGRDAIETAHRLADRFQWRATGFIAQENHRLTGTLLAQAGVQITRLVLRPVEDSEALSFTALVSEAPFTGPDLARTIVYDGSDETGDGVRFHIEAPPAGRYLAVVIDEHTVPLGCLLPVITVRENDEVAGEVWWCHGGVIAGWVDGADGAAPDLEITSSPPAGLLAYTVAPLTQAGHSDCAGRQLFGFAAVLPLDTARQSIDVRVKKNGKSLRGAPLRLDGQRGLALTPALHSFEVEPPDWHLLPKARRVFGSPSQRDAMIDVVVPVYRDQKKTQRCIESVLKAANKAAIHLIIVNDRSPSPAVTAFVRSLTSQPRVTVIENPQNLGFSGAVNVGMRQHPERDVVLLNADTEVADGWLDRLLACAQDSPDIATVTPLSNNATILSYPAAHAVNPFVTGAGLAALNHVFSQGRSVPLEIPTAVGFCMFIRRACLNDCGDFDEVNFGRGYGEENEFCLRAAARGWRHACAPNVLVAHDGGISFAGQHGVVQQRRLNALQNTFKGYDRFIQRFVLADPLRVTRRAADVARLEGDPAPTVLMVMPELVGGTARHVNDLCRALERDGVRCLIWSGAKAAVGANTIQIKRWREPAADAVAAQPADDPFPNLLYDLPFEASELRDAVRRLGIQHVHVHHFLDLPWDSVTLATRLGIPYDVSIHDYAWACPRVTMVGPSQRYCGEPDLAGCNACVAVAGDRTGSGLDVAGLRTRSAALLGGARSVFVSNADVKDRLYRYFPDAPFVLRPHPFATGLVSQTSKFSHAIAIVGAINSDKGYDVLLACARDAAKRKLPLCFAIIGFTQDDARLLSTGCVSITGGYAENEAPALVAASGARVGWVPSVCPETWSYALSQILASGLLPVAFNLGAPAQRIKALGQGALLPLDLQPREINDALVQLTRRDRGSDGPRSDAGEYPNMLTDYYDFVPAVASVHGAAPTMRRDRFGVRADHGPRSERLQRHTFDRDRISRFPLQA